VILLVDAQTVGVLVTATSVTVAAIYYMFTLNISQHNMKTTLETRQAQLFTDFTKQMIGDYWKNHEEIRNDWSWKNYDDFDEKYGGKKNPEMWNKWLTTLGMYEEMGILFKNGVFDVEMMFDQIGGYTISLWEKYEPVLFEYRLRTGGNGQMEYFEDLYYHMKELNKLDDDRYKERAVTRASKRRSLGLPLTPFYEKF